MALSKKKSSETKREAHMMVVKRAYRYPNNNISFDLEIDKWITIYNMTLVATYSEADKEEISKLRKNKKKDIDWDKFEPESYFIAFPQHQDDDGNWWSYAYFKILEEEQDVIEDQIEHRLDEAEDEK